ncbi:MAG: hypothetical protein A3B16_02605 [Candidatus Zambryskibacteria bacterium RIFCSPLOWO2_01_FULL_45_43]|uniref:Uncharacterized protein n=1 Tax=Candidatus Zambryskibacteria bacterium RIFCSPLOWO2_01_FULL_45_43 TaxID=1802762 RepID=A0A1G2U8P3_9BACT|nr:MAG: hypothetical protein A3B16_02605 [Candidatus Zambryskibacteria bacterium RIFCSPLOWO2_01_FULL_45_43]
MAFLFLMRKFLTIIVISAVFLLPDSIGVERAVALSPSMEVEDCWRISKEEQSERCKEVVASFEETDRNWPRVNRASEKFDQLVAYLKFLVPVAVIAGGILIYRKRNKKT